MKKVVFLSPMCPLDNSSGAAKSMKTWLEWLAEAGFYCKSLTMSLFDGSYEYNFGKVVGNNVAVKENIGKIIRVNIKKVQYNIFYTSSTIGKNVVWDEQKRFLKIVEKFFEENRPEIVVSYGSSNYTKLLQKMARKYCKKFIFYLANTDFTDNSLFYPDDIIVCPSNFSANYYKKLLNIDPYVINSAVDPYNYSEKSMSRKEGFISYINPHPAKGLTFFWRLAGMAEKKRPDLTFLAVEGRLSLEQLHKSRFDVSSLPNVWWIPNQSDIKRVYERTNILIFPSFWAESAGRVIPEAQLSCIPVLASKRGGIPEQLNGGGFLFDIPERCTKNYLEIPTEEEVMPWLEIIAYLVDNEEAYAKFSEKSKKAGEYFLPKYRKKAVVDFFKSLALT